MRRLRRALGRLSVDVGGDQVTDGDGAFGHGIDFNRKSQFFQVVKKFVIKQEFSVVARERAKVIDIIIFKTKTLQKINDRRQSGGYDVPALKWIFSKEQMEN
jgi:hypothetical protein